MENQLILAGPVIGKKTLHLRQVFTDYILATFDRSHQLAFEQVLSGVYKVRNNIVVFSDRSKLRFPWSGLTTLKQQP